MSTQVSFEHVEELAAKLPPVEQFKLLARLSEQLHDTMRTFFRSTTPRQLEREVMADALMTELDVIAEGIEGRFDSAEDIRQIREERVERL